MTFITIFGFLWCGLEEKYMAASENDHIWGPKQPTNQYRGDHCLDKWKIGKFSILNNFYIAIWHSIETWSYWDMRKFRLHFWMTFSHERVGETESPSGWLCPSWSQNSQIRLEILISLGFSPQNPSFHFYWQKTPSLEMKFVGFTVPSHLTLIIPC